jgi:PhnB protein
MREHHTDPRRPARYGVLRDPFGHHWSLGQQVREVSMEELSEAMSQGESG